jgi:glycogen synthase kinase 3 beta
VFRSRTPPDAIDLISKLLVYNPERRLKPLEALCHGFFDELRDKNTRLPNGNPLPDLFAFQKEEISSTSPQIMEQLIPEWYVAKAPETRD